jgi:hypothetical protein
MIDAPDVSQLVQVQDITSFPDYAGASRPSANRVTS